jgi:hypothetical protein
MADDESSHTKALKSVAESYFSLLRAIREYHDACDASALSGPIGETEEQAESWLRELEVSRKRAERGAYAWGRTKALFITLTYGVDEPSETSGPELATLLKGDQDPYGASVVCECTNAMEAVEHAAQRAKVLCDIYKLGEAEGFPCPVDSVERKAYEADYYAAVEEACSRLCGYWDRVGQLLCFVFFNLREFDRSYPR